MEHTMRAAIGQRLAEHAGGPGGAGVIIMSRLADYAVDTFRLRFHLAPHTHEAMLTLADESS
jgi:hypothetical protein